MKRTQRTRGIDLTLDLAHVAMPDDLTLTESEGRIMDEIAVRREELVALASVLIGFNTTAREHNDDPPREEAALQEYLAERLRAAGAETEIWEPAPEDMAGSPPTDAARTPVQRSPAIDRSFPGQGSSQLKKAEEW